MPQVVALYLFHINASQGANLWQRLGVYPFMEGHTHEQWEIVLVSALFIHGALLTALDSMLTDHGRPQTQTLRNGVGLSFIYIHGALLTELDSML